jgi:hypothetical protein
MFDMLGKLGDMANLTEMKVPQILEMFPQIEGVLSQLNVLDFCKSEAAQNLSLAEVAQQHNIELPNVMELVTNLMGKKA